MVEGIQPNPFKIQKYLENSLMLVTALAPKIGYKRASEIAQNAHEKNISLRESALDLNYISEEDFDKYVNPISMISPQ